MKKNTITLVLLLLSGITLAQVGINTVNPQQTFHIDGAKDNPIAGVPSAIEQINDFVVTQIAQVGIGASTPSEKMDIATGNIRIRDINSNVGVGTTDRTVVADANGVLKTLDFGNYSLFHARLAANQPVTGAISTLLFSSPLATSPLYNYNPATGTLTFTQAGNYLISVQASFVGFPDPAVITQLTLGVRPVPDANYLARGSHFNTVVTPASVGELMNYTTLLVIPTSGYQIRFTVVASQNCTVQSTETGGTGSGNVTNITIQKI